MKRGFTKLIIYCNVLLLCCLFHPGGYTCADEPTPDKDNVNELKSTIKKQEETIKQLQDEMKKLQENMDQIRAKQTLPNPVEKALRDSCSGRRIKVEGEIVRITFTSFHDITYFFDTGPEQHARRDLDIFLKTAKLSKGTIEYYNIEKKVFSITGSLTSAKTEMFQ